LITDAIKHHNARLLIIDPLMAYLCGPDANKDQEIRRVLYRLSRAAEENNCAIIAMRHLNKTSGTKAIYRGNSSIAVIGHARTGLLVAEDPDDRRKRVLAISKTNLARTPASLRFAIETADNTPRIGWIGQANFSANDLLEPTLTPEQQAETNLRNTNLAEARGLLALLLQTTNGEIPAELVKAEMKAADISKSTYYQALQAMNLRTHYQTDASGKRTYYWSPKP
jgi:hypothetical protein